MVDSSAFKRLSHPARALLLEIARQYAGDNNGRLLASRAHLSPRGWNSVDVITRAKRELIDAKLIHETVKGRRPNKASWYAVTWYQLDKLPGFDPDAALDFVRGAYRDQPVGRDGVSSRPPHGVARSSIAPPGGAGSGAT